MKGELAQTIGESKLAYDVAIYPIKPDVQNLINLIGYINSGVKLSEADINKLFVPDENFKTARELVRDANFPDFDSLQWISYSETKFNLERKKIKSDGIKNVIAKAVEIAQITPGSFVKLFFIGDYKPVSEFALVIANSQLQYKDFDIDWFAFTTDPYLTVRNDGTIETPIVKPNQFYDDFVGEKWFCGSDNTGELNANNLIWLNEKIPKEISPIINIAVLDRKDYMSYDVLKRDIQRYYNSLLSLIASSNTGGTAVLQISLPNIPALDGIVVLFATFFSFLRIIKLKQDLPDNDKVYLLGTSFNKNVNTNSIIYNTEQLNFLVNFLSQKDKMYPILNFMSNLVSPYHQQLNIVVQRPLRSYLESLIESWPSRNI